MAPDLSQLIAALSNGVAFQRAAFRPLVEPRPLHISNQYVFTFPALSPDFCQMLIDAAEQAKAWASVEGDPYPGRETRLSDISPVFDELFRKVWAAVVNPWLAEVYPRYTTSADKIETPFIIKQTPVDPGMDTHFDEVSDVTFSIPLSGDWEGRGLTFPNRSDVPDFSGPVGTALCFPGGPTHAHRVPPISEGHRYSLTIWTRGN